MPANENYIKALEVAKENGLMCKDYISEAETFLTELAAESQVDYPYIKDLQEIQKLITSFLQQIDIDLKEMSEMEETGETDTEAEDNTETETESM